MSYTDSDGYSDDYDDAPDSFECGDHVCWTEGCDRLAEHETRGEDDCADFEETQPMCEQCLWETNDAETQ